MRAIKVMGSVIKHSLGLCFFFVLGLVLGAIPLGILVSFLNIGSAKDPPIIGALIGGICLASVYVTINLTSHSQGKKESHVKERLVKQLLGLCFWSFSGFVGGIVLLAYLYPYVRGGSDPWTGAVALLGGFVGAGCLAVGYIEYCRGRFSSSTNRASPSCGTTDQRP